MMQTDAVRLLLGIQQALVPIEVPTDMLQHSPEGKAL